jgi:hypothetical protein
MTKCRFVSLLFPMGLILLFAGLLLAQSTPNPSGRPLIVNGKPAGNVVQMDGRSYVELEALVQATNGSLTLQADRALLTIPTPAPVAEAPSSAPAPPQAGLSRNFASQAIGGLAEMREWRGAVGTVLSYNVPVVGTWPQDYRDRVKANLDELSIAATTSDDEAAMSLLRNDFSMLSDWADTVVAARANLDATKSVRPTAVQDDPALAKITACSRFLNSMLVSGIFADSPNCH